MFATTLRRMTVPALALAMSLGASAHAAVWQGDASGELSGSRNSGVAGGVTGLQQWGNGNFVIDWDISFDSGTNLWTYNYSVNVTSKDISHIIFEVTQDNDPFLLAAGSTTPDGGAKTYTATSNGNSNVLMPNPMYGIKFGGNSTSEDYTIITDRAPVYGVFYAVDGKKPGEEVVAWADALNFADYKVNDTLLASQFIVRPNGAGSPPPPPGPDPDPATIGLDASAADCVIVGASITVDITVSNTAGPGSSNLDYVLSSLSAPLSINPPTTGLLAPGNSNLHSGLFDSTGLSAGQYVNTVQASDPNATNDPQTKDVIIDVHDHANPSFEPLADVNKLHVDFGTIIGTSGTPLSFTVGLENLENTIGFTAGLDLDSFLETDDDGDPAAGTFSIDLTTFSAMLAGTGTTFDVFFDVSAEGFFSARYVLNFSDEDCEGAADLGSLILCVEGEVVPRQPDPDPDPQPAPGPVPEPASMVMIAGALGLLGLRRRR